MEKQPMPPMLTSLLDQLRDKTMAPQARENIANRLEDVAAELMREVQSFRGRPGPRQSMRLRARG